VLPLIAYFAVQSAWRKLALFTLVLLYGQFVDPKGPLLFLFVMGAIAAELAAYPNVKRFLAGPVAAALSAAVLGYTMFTAAPHHSLQSIVPLFPFFACVASGNSFFGLLTSRPLTALGVVSYSIYLLHMPLVYGGLRFFDAFIAPVRSLSLLGYWSVITAIACLAVVLSVCTFFGVEARFMRPARERRPAEVRGGAAIKPF